MSDWPDKLVERVAAALPFADQASKERLALQALNALGGERVLYRENNTMYFTYKHNNMGGKPALFIPLEGGDVGD